MCIGMCIGEKRKTREMAFGVVLLWFVLLPSPLQFLLLWISLKSLFYQQLKSLPILVAYGFYHCDPPLVTVTLSYMVR